MRIRSVFSTLAPLLVGVAYGCGAAPSDETSAADDAYTSASAELLDFDFDGEVTTDNDDVDGSIHQQMLFTIGELNGTTGVGRLDKVVITNINADRQGDLMRIRYHAKLPVSIAKTARIAKTFALVLPKRTDRTGQEAFFKKYSATSCTDRAAHDNEAGIYWYYYRPDQDGCSLAAADVMRATATVTASPENTKNTYPEYDKIWSDNALNVVAIFGKVEDGAKTDSDRGIWSHGHFVSTMRQTLPNAKVTPANTPDSPGVANPDVTIESTLANGKKVKLTSFLVDNVRQGGAAFEARYNELSGDADVIVYNGHAGLGENVRALARMGTFKAGKYQIVYMNGCDTFAYVDGTLAEMRAKLNPTDPTGTKFMEILTNSMPPDWDSLPNNTISLVRDLMKIEAPVKYTDVLAHFDQSGFATVTGDEDNTYKP